MVYWTDSNSSQFRIEINGNFIWDFLYQQNYKNYRTFPVAKIADLAEDAINMVDISKKSRLEIHDIIRFQISLALKKNDEN